MIFYEGGSLLFFGEMGPLRVEAIIIEVQISHPLLELLGQQAAKETKAGWAFCMYSNL